MTCKECVHYDMCLETFRKSKERGNYSNTTEEEYFSNWFDCDFFLPKSRFMGLPCEVGQKVWFIKKDRVPDDDYRMSFHTEWVIGETHFQLSMISQFGKTVFLSKEEAEKALQRKEDEGK